MIVELCTNCGEYVDGRGYCHECGIYTLLDDDGDLDFTGEDDEAE